MLFTQEKVLEGQGGDYPGALSIRNRCLPSLMNPSRILSSFLSFVKLSGEKPSLPSIDVGVKENHLLKLSHEG